VSEGARPVVTHVDVGRRLGARRRDRRRRAHGASRPRHGRPLEAERRRGKKIEYELDAEETLFVLRGGGELRVDEGEPIELRPGVVVSLSRGSRLCWLVDAEFREVWVYS
jgi:hypothetical protein